MQKLFISLLFVIAAIGIHAQTEITLYADTIPNALPCKINETPEVNGTLRIGHITVPTLTIFTPPKEKQTGAAVLILPGGGYNIVAIEKEGFNVAKAFNEAGVTAFVLKYRIPDDSCMADKMLAPLMDAQQALYLIRKNAAEYGVDTTKVGIMGFSAGGHIAATVSTHFDRPARKEMSGYNLRPDFSILIYPVISFHPAIAHMGSRQKLLGRDTTQSWENYFSNEDQITSHTPPAFLVHASDDNTVPVANSIAYYTQLLHYQIPAELHVYEHGGHGFGLNNATTQDNWFALCLNWMRTNKWL